MIEFSKTAGSSRHRKIMAEVQKHGTAQNEIEQLTYKELADATDDFSENSKIGEGGFGIVYKGHIKSIDQVCFL